MSGPTFESYSLAGRTLMLDAQSQGGTYRVGFIVTPHGIVGLYTQWEGPMTRLECARDGRIYTAQWLRTFTDRRLKTLARRFAQKVALSSSKMTQGNQAGAAE